MLEELQMRIEEPNPGYKNVILSRGEKSLSIAYSGNLDLYFTFNNQLEDGRNYFIIKEEDEIYKLFLKLYEDIKECSFVGESDKTELALLKFDCEVLKLNFERELELYRRKNKKKIKKLKESREYHRLFQDDKIICKDDNFPVDVAPIMTIIKHEHFILLTFKLPPKPDRELDREERSLYTDTDFLEIRIRNDGSRYQPFNNAFMDLFNALCELRKEGKMNLERRKNNGETAI